MEVTSRVSMLISSIFSLLLIFGLLQVAVSAGTKGLGEPCSYDTDCQEAHAYCDESGTGCDCKAGYTKSTNKTKCLTVEGSYELGGKCEEDVQCAFTDKGSTCKGGQCRACDDNTVKCDDPTGCDLHDFEGKCWKSKKLGDRCSSDEQCWMLPGAEASRKCASQICVCVAETETDKCMEGSRSEDKSSENAAPAFERSAWCATVIAAMLVMFNHPVPLTNN